MKASAPRRPTRRPAGGAVPLFGMFRAGLDARDRDRVVQSGVKGFGKVEKMMDEVETEGRAKSRLQMQMVKRGARGGWC